MFAWWCVILVALLIAFVAYTVGYNGGFRRGFRVVLDLLQYGDVEDDETIVWRANKPEEDEGNEQENQQEEIADAVDQGSGENGAR